jgi:hypothetical protein
MKLKTRGFKSRFLFEKNPKYFIRLIKCNGGNFKGFFLFQRANKIVSIFIKAESIAGS